MDGGYFRPNGHIQEYETNWNASTPAWCEMKNNNFKKEIQDAKIDVFQHFLYTEGYNRADLQEKVQIMELNHPPLVIPKQYNRQFNQFVPFGVSN